MVGHSLRTEDGQESVIQQADKYDARKFLDTIPQLGILQDVVGRKLRVWNTLHLQNLDHCTGESTLGLVRSAFHEQDDRTSFNSLGYLVSCLLAQKTVLDAKPGRQNRRRNSRT